MSFESLHTKKRESSSPREQFSDDNAREQKQHIEEWRTIRAQQKEKAAAQKMREDAAYAEQIAQWREKVSDRKPPKSPSRLMHIVLIAGSILLTITFLI